MRIAGLYLLLVLLNYTTLFANTKKGKPLPEEYLEKALECIQLNKTDSCAYYQKQALELYRTQDDLLNWIETNKQIGRAYRNARQQEKALESFKRATLEQLFRQPKSEEEWKVLGWNYVNLGYTYGWKLALDNDAIPYYEQAKTIFSDQLHTADILVGQFVFRDLGNIYSRTGDYSAAEIMLSKFKDICIEYKAYSKAAEAYSDLGLMYKESDNYKKAIQTFKEGLKLPMLEPRSLGLLHVNLMKTHIAQKRYSLALQHAQKAQANFNQVIKTDEDKNLAKAWLASTIIEMGNIFTAQEKYETAENHLKQAKKIFDTIYPGTQRQDFGILYDYFGNLYCNWGKYDLALSYYQKALQCILPNFNYTSEFDNPNPEHYYANISIIESLSGKAKTLSERFQYSKELRDLEVALECHEQIFKIEQLLRSSYRYQSSKLSRLEESRSRSEKSIAIALELWKQTGNINFKRKAFSLAERSKSVLLLEVFLKTDANAIAGIPEALLNKEKTLQREIANTEKTLFNTIEQGGKEDLVKNLEEQLLRQRQEYTIWINELEQRYPQYYNLKYNLETSSISSIQQLLAKEDRTLIEYFVGDSMIYTFVISSDRFEILEQEKAFPLEDWVIEFRNSIEQFQAVDANRSELCTQYTDKAFRLYTKLIEPVEQLKVPSNWTIIPSGLLGLLPFDALLTQTPEYTCVFNNYPYLVYDHSISYGYSATLQVALAHRPKYGNSFVGFGPNFDGGEGFSPLKFNKTTIESIITTIGGSPYFDDAATLEQFQAIANQYGIIQLATHAQANTNKGNFSFIVFSDGKGGYDSLFVNDLYLIELGAEMVVLSACETGLGTLHNGEGIISLARGFLHAGAKSVLTTLWSINDESNKMLMADYYTFLKEGESKDKALQQAKITQLKKADQLYAHPVYWAAFAPVGDMRPIFRDFTLFYLIGLLALIATIFSFFRRKNKEGTERDSVIRKLIRQKPWAKVGL